MLEVLASPIRYRHVVEVWVTTHWKTFGAADAPLKHLAIASESV
jgi:hypothetical protein